jgi:hypothetical protein
MNTLQLLKDYLLKAFIVVTRLHMQMADWMNDSGSPKQ